MGVITWNLHLLPGKDVDRRTERSHANPSSTCIPNTTARLALVRDRYEFHESQPVGAWRPRVWLHRQPHAVEPQGEWWVLAGRGRPRRSWGPGCAPPAPGHDRPGARIARFGDNMREVAVTEGDKVEAQIRLGYSVNGYGVGELVRFVEAVTRRRDRPAGGRVR